MTKLHSEKRSSSILYSTPMEEQVVIRCHSSHENKSFYTLISEKVPARLVLYILSWSGFLVSFIMRNDMNFAIIAMVRPSNQTSNSTFNSTINTTTTNMAIYDKQYEWSSTVKSIIISTFYWWYVLSQVVGGIATQHFGTKKVFGWSQFATAVCSLCIPFASDLHYTIVILLRSIQGFASGLTWPAMYALVGCWIPLSERSRFMSSFQGFSIGIGLTYPLCGVIIKYCGSWTYVFYVTGSLGLTWCLFWYLLAFNTPNKHPRITPEELQYIETNKTAEESVGMKVPWKKIFTSWPAWAIGITTFGRIWIHYVFIINGPMFMKAILKFDYEANGFLSGMPFVCSYFSSVFFCYVADKMIVQNSMTLTNVRKVFTAMSQLVPGILIFAIGHIENIEQLLVLWFIAVSFITASYAGAMANIVDIAPNFAGPVLAFCQTIHMSASFISPLVNGYIYDNHEDSIEHWRIIFGVATVVTGATYVVYQKHGTADIQKWNKIEIDNGNSEENQKLQNT